MLMGSASRRKSYFKIYLGSLQCFKSNLSLKKRSLSVGEKTKITLMAVRVEKYFTIILEWLYLKFFSLFLSSLLL